jgi:hypothetical protein
MGAEGSSMRVFSVSVLVGGVFCEMEDFSSTEGSRSTGGKPVLELLGASPGASPAAKTTNDLPVGQTSPITKQNKIPVPKNMKAGNKR